MGPNRHVPQWYGLSRFARPQLEDSVATYSFGVD